MIVGRLARATCAVVLLVASASAVRAQPAVHVDGVELPFPDYSREEVADTCVSEYGIGSSSLLDCLAQDEKTRKALSPRWADLDSKIKLGCMTQLEGMRLKSYLHLSNCIQAAKAEDYSPE